MLGGGPRMTGSELRGGGTAGGCQCSGGGVGRLVLKGVGSPPMDKLSLQERTAALGLRKWGDVVRTGPQAARRGLPLVPLCAPPRPPSLLESPLVTMPNRSNRLNRTRGSRVPKPASRSWVWEFGAETQKLRTRESHAMKTAGLGTGMNPVVRTCYKLIQMQTFLWLGSLAYDTIN